MQTKVIRLALGCLVLAASVAASAEIKWGTNYDAAITRAKATNKLLMIEFYATWDLNTPDAKNWSGVMERLTFKDSNVGRLATKFIPVRLAVDQEGKALAKKFGITNYPTILFVDKTGRDVGTVDGVESPDEFIKHANVFLKDYKEEPALRAKYRKNPKDLDAIARLGAIEGDRYHIAAALNKMREAEKLDPTNKTDKLSDLYSAIGDYYQNRADYASAIPYFKKTADSSKMTDKRAYALLSIATCYMSMGRPVDPTEPPTISRDEMAKNFKTALPYVQQVLALPNLKAEDKQIAETDLQNIQQFLNSGEDGSR